MEQTKYIQSLKNVMFSKLINLGMIKTGTFTLKNGAQSNIYIDLRQLVNYPHFFSYLTRILYLKYPQLLDTLSHTNSKLIPIPLGGLPLGFHLAYDKRLPLLMIRDKVKDHGTKKLIEGIVESNDQYILVEDVITSGISIIQTLDNISSHLVNNNSMTAIICICNRGGLETLQNIPIYSIFTLEELQVYIYNYLILSPRNDIINNITNNITNNISYFQYTNTFSNKLYQLALIKQSNIIISCDFMTNNEIIEIIETIGNKIIAVKLHLDILESSNYSLFINHLNTLKNKYNFLVIEDAKYADIDSIMIDKINHSQLDICKVADAFTMHAIAGLSILEGNKLKIPGIIVAEMSSSNTLINLEYTQQIIRAFHNHNATNIDILGGIVCQSQIPKLIKPFEIATMSPGINLDITNDTHNQQYKIPNLAYDNKLGLFWIVGRGITIYKNKKEKLIEVMNTYQSKGWDYFIKY